MTAKSHVNTTIAIGILPLYFYRHELAFIMFDYIAVYVIGLVVGSLLPDIEESHSVVGRSVPRLSRWLNRKIGHRTYTHNILVYVPIFIFSYIMSLNSISLIYIALMGFSIGSILHSLEDCMTNGGVRGALRPFINNFVLLKRELRFNTNGRFENLVYYPFITILLALEVIVAIRYILNIY